MITQKQRMNVTPFDRDKLDRLEQERRDIKAMIERIRQMRDDRTPPATTSPFTYAIESLIQVRLRLGFDIDDIESRAMSKASATGEL